MVEPKAIKAKFLESTFLSSSTKLGSLTFFVLSFTKYFFRAGAFDAICM